MSAAEREVARANAQDRINAINAQKSTGPKTDEGKRISAQNAFKHGFAGATIVLHDEDKVAYDAHLDAYFRRFKPADQVEADTIRRAANSMRKYDRLTTIEATLLEWEGMLQTPRADSIMDGLEPPPLDPRLQRTMRRALARELPHRGPSRPGRTLSRLRGPRKGRLAERTQAHHRQSGSRRPSTHSELNASNSNRASGPETMPRAA